MNKYLELILSLPKSIYLNFRMLPFREAVSLPIFVRYNTILSNCSGRLLLLGGARFGCVKFGFGHVGCFDKRYERSIWDVGGTLEIKGNAYIGTGSRIIVGGNGHLVLGNSFVNTAKITIICYRRIEFGDNVLISWESLIMDTDFHRVSELKKNTDSEREKDVIILKSATYRVSWEFTCKTTKILLLYIFLGHNRNVVNTKFPYPIKRLEVIRRFNQKSIAFNQSLS